MNVNSTLDALCAAYGEGEGAPTRAQWEAVLRRDPDAPFALINFFKFREMAAYGDDTLAISGQEAFQRYATVSMPAMMGAGGSFLLVGPHQGSLIGPDPDWDMVAIGHYPNLQAFCALYHDEAYQTAFADRTAAVARQSVLVVGQSAPVGPEQS